MLSSLEKCNIFFCVFLRQELWIWWKIAGCSNVWLVSKIEPFMRKMGWTHQKCSANVNIDRLYCSDSRCKNLWAICAEDVGNYLRPSKQSRPAIGWLPNCLTNSRPGLNRIFLMVAAWLRLLGGILFQNQIWIQIFIQTNIFLFYFFSITSTTVQYKENRLDKLQGQSFRGNSSGKGSSFSM